MKRILAYLLVFFFVAGILVAFTTEIEVIGKYYHTMAMRIKPNEFWLVKNNMRKMIVYNAYELPWETGKKYYIEYVPLESPGKILGWKKIPHLMIGVIDYKEIK